MTIDLSVYEPAEPCPLDHSDVSDLCLHCGWRATVEHAAAVAEASTTEALAVIAEDTSRDLGALWRSAAAGHMRGLDWVLPAREPQAKSPRWATPIGELDMATNGGIYGLTGLRGSAKSGKSMFALLLALLCAWRDGMMVIYAAAEMTRDQIMGRLGWLAREHGCAPEELDRIVREQLLIFHSRGEFTWDEFSDFVAAGLLGQTSALVVIDSINTLLADMDDDEGGSYWTRYRRVLRTVIGVRKQTEGAFSALIISEHNKQRASKGEQLEYAADLMLDFQQTKTPRVCKITVVGTREHGADGPLGEFRMTPFATYERVRAEA